MSGITGVFNRNARPVERAFLGGMLERLAHRGPDGTSLWVDGPIGMGVATLRTTEESIQEFQPVADESGTIRLTWDGRVDNRAQLRRALEDRGWKLRNESDAELVLRAYQHWGVDCPAQIIGDFALALWDGRCRQLFCARDYLGIRPFYYAVDSRTFRWASELGPFFADPTFPVRVNEGMVAEFLADSIHCKEETLFQNLRRLPPAHYLVVKNSSTQLVRYWDLDSVAYEICSTPEDFAERFYSLFSEATRSRLRSTGKVGIELSGGLDSSSVAALSRRVLSTDRDRHRALETFSLLFPGLACDERSQIEEVVKGTGIEWNAVCPREQPEGYFLDLVDRFHDFPGYPNGVMADELKAHVQARGIRVVLTGWGGDEWLGGSVYHYVDLLSGMKMAELVRRVRSDVGLAATPLMLAQAVRAAFAPLVPGRLRQALRRRRMEMQREPSWINRAFARRNCLPDRIAAGERRPKGRNRSQAELHRNATSGAQVYSQELEERTAAWFNIEQRHPLHDRRLVEFALGLPEGQRHLDGCSKVVLRQAMRGLLPEKIRGRLSKADFSVIFVRAMQMVSAKRAFESLSLARVGWIDGERVLQMHRRMAGLYAKGHPGFVSYVWPLWAVWGIELWYNRVFRDHARRSMIDEQPIRPNRPAVAW